MFKLDTNSPLPLYFQLAKKIEQHIMNGEWSVGEMIPSERELVRLTSVSRHTVRQAIGYLVDQGMLTKTHGKGTYINHPKIEVEQSLHGFVYHMKAMGIDGHDEFIESKIVDATAYMATLLEVPLGEKLNYFKRLRYLDNVPCILGISYVPHRLCPDLLTKGVRLSLYQQLADDYNLPVLRSVDTLESIPSDEETARLLGVDSGYPLMYRHRIAFSHNDLPIQINYNYIRGDMFRIRLNLGNPQDPSLLNVDHSVLNRPLDALLDF